MTTNIINGGLECGFATDARVQDRIGYFKRYAGLLGVDPGSNLECNTQRAFAAGRVTVLGTPPRLGMQYAGKQAAGQPYPWCRPDPLWDCHTRTAPCLPWI
jgi:hypothetical protein